MRLDTALTPVHETVAASDVFEHRLADYSLSDEQAALAAAVRALLMKANLPEAVRQVPAGFDESLYGRLVELGVSAMGLPSAAGGDDAGVADLVAAAEVMGELLAPVAFAELTTGSRLLARCDPQAPAVAAAAAGTARIAFALVDLGTEQWVPGGAAATHVIGRRGGDIVLVELDVPLPQVPTHGDQPVGQWTGSAQADMLVAHGTAAYDVAADEWAVLTASVLVGVADLALGLGVEFATIRQTRGVAIGSLQAVSHLLAQCQVQAAVARNLTRKAAWFLDHEPEFRPELPDLAFVTAARAAAAVAHASVHVHGGQGVSLESDIALAFTRAMGIPMVEGAPDRRLPGLGRRLLARHVGSDT